jgi:hypothetical protein
VAGASACAGFANRASASTAAAITGPSDKRAGTVRTLRAPARRSNGWGSVPRAQPTWSNGDPGPPAGAPGEHLP